MDVLHIEDIYFPSLIEELEKSFIEFKENYCESNVKKLEYEAEKYEASFQQAIAGIRYVYWESEYKVYSQMQEIERLKSKLAKYE